MNLGYSVLTNRLSHLIQISSTGHFLKNVVRSPSLAAIQARDYAARKGTRERKSKAKVKMEVKKIGFIPHNLRNREKMLASRASKKYDDSWKRDPIDDVYVMKYYKWTVHSFVDAVKAHRETHHPEIYNRPNAELFVTIDLNMQGEKKTRFVDNFKRIAGIPHKFDIKEERTVIAFAKNTESIQEAIKAGAQMSGGVDLIKQIQNGQVLLQDFQHVIAHPDILAELLVLRGIMKKKFPNTKSGTLDANLGPVVDRFLNGIAYQALKDEYEHDFGQIETVIGTLNMDPEDLERNFIALINDIYTQKPKREGQFVTRCLLWSPPSDEKLKVGFSHYLIDNKKKASEEAADEVIEESVAAV
ncbi:39S ribosomal protein L1, mitochondrial [Dendroctonus ponderosae]|uniref:39S ribosomal protein L1, mitochondrial n=2 Tax=Dendroctonus ponderosae TaxID=77166 RepID=J3JVE1_DENPD|nr:39S ribosomal protein L1, mitochondrial [Dendroctonus ponderosae]AEE62170.1 unknown [Dendroctonus ponderosae]ERL89871.1 hypothetical protein D910_07230 [Dendroctonus ponderosae]KAH1012858.1 hypothetical protein HUJ05_011938 [Dendroctonus ponderosae]